MSRFGLGLLLCLLAIPPATAHVPVACAQLFLDVSEPVEKVVENMQLTNTLYQRGAEYEAFALQVTNMMQAQNRLMEELTSALLCLHRSQ